MEDYTKAGITKERLDEMKLQAMVLEDEIIVEGGKMLEMTGKLSDPELCKKSVEYENLTLEILEAEKKVLARDND